VGVGTVSVVAVDAASEEEGGVVVCRWGHFVDGVEDLTFCPPSLPVFKGIVFKTGQQILVVYFVCILYRHPINAIYPNKSLEHKC
jgi:hypothetical protein